MRAGIIAFCVVPMLIGATHAKAPALSQYIGRYPFQKVAGLTFTAHPVVRRAVEDAVLDSVVRLRVLNSNQTAGPIAADGEFIINSGCEEHNCGDHNWKIIITRSGRKAAVCYYNEQLTDGAKWFIGGFSVFKQAGISCDNAGFPNPVRLAIVR